MSAATINPHKSHFFDAPGDEFDQLLAAWNWPKYRAQQVRDWVFQKHAADPGQMTNLAKLDRQRLADALIFFSANIAVRQSSSDGTDKLLLTWPGQDVESSAETVMIPDGDRRTACVSSQVGCPVGCKFCASGLGGVKGNLTAGQIVEQVFALEGSGFGVQGSEKAPSHFPLNPEPRTLNPPSRINHIVFMGMGEPLANYANVLRAIRILHDPRCFNIGARKITVSTVGVPARMRQLAGEDLPLNLAISLHAPNEPLRRQLIPWAEHFALADILDAARYYFERTGREVTLEYILLSGVNDRPEHARQLVQVCRGLRANVNLIRYNEVESLPYQRPKSADVVEFQSILRRGGVNAHVRKSRGRDIDAACGQLRRREQAPQFVSLPTGFTLMETLVSLGILIILLSIFVPYVQSIRETSRRVTCERNLYILRDGLRNYANDNGHDYPRVVYDPETEGYTAFTGADDPNPFAANSAVKPNDVTASLWLLVRLKLVSDTHVFICPSSDDTRDFLTDSMGQVVDVSRRGNFRKPSNLSYSYASPFSSAPGYRMNDTKRAEFGLVADKSPGAAAAQVPYGGADVRRANSPNHSGAGQNVLYVDGHVEFQKTPYCGVGDDNVYTARAAKFQMTTQPTTLAANVAGVVGPGFGPVQGDDSYLIPTATDVQPPPVMAAVQMPASATRAGTTTSAPATAQ